MSDAKRVRQTPRQPSRSRAHANVPGQSQGLLKFTYFNSNCNLQKVEKDSSVDANSPTAPTIAKKLRKKRSPADTPVSSVAPPQQATTPESTAIVPSGTPVAAASTTSGTAVTAAPVIARSPVRTPQVPPPSAQVASKRASGDNHNAGVALPVPVSVTDAGTAWRKRKSQLPASGQSVEDMLLTLDRHCQKNPTESVSKAIESEDEEDERSVDENEIELDAESSSHVTSDDSNPFEDKSEAELSGNENDDVVDDEDAEDDAEGSEEEAAPEPLPVKTPKKGMGKSAKEATVKQKTPIVDAGGSGKVQRKKAVSSAGVTKRVPIAKSSRASSAVKAGPFYDAPKGKATPKATTTSRTRSANK